jgi:hypothetical protein
MFKLITALFSQASPIVKFAHVPELLRHVAEAVAAQTDVLAVLSIYGVLIMGVAGIIGRAIRSSTLQND